VLVEPIAFAQSFRPTDAELVLGSGPIADEMRELGLGPRPVAYQFAPKTEAILFAPRNLDDE